MLNRVMYKAFKYELRPTQEQELVLNQWMGCGRWVWNYCLQENIAQHKIDGKFIFRFDLKKQLPILKKQFPWLAEAPSQAMQNRVLDFDTALRRVWKVGSGFPKFKCKAIEHHNTLRIDQTGGQIKPKKKYISIPKMGDIRYIKHRQLEGKLKNITIKKQNNKWFIICLCELPDPKKREFDPELAVGIDLGIKQFAFLSDGESFDSPCFNKKQKARLKRKQRKLAKKQKGSNNRNKTKKELNKTHCEIKNQRDNFTHQLSTSITNKYIFPMSEDLRISNMVKNRKLAKAISDQGWRQFIDQLHYKSLNNGGCLTKIDTFLPSSKTCSVCGAEKKSLSLSERVFTCDHCPAIIDRDLNAAQNILIWGRIELNRAGTARIYACEDSSDGGDGMSSPSHGSLKQE